MSDHQTLSRISSLKERCTPPPYKLFREYKELRAEGLTRLDALRDLHVGTYLFKVAASLAINRLTARAFGYGAWDPSFSGDTANRLKDSSSVSLTLSTWIASAVPPSYAGYATALEFALCIPRIWVEQKAFQRLGITPDPLGPILTPYTAGALDLLYKGYEITSMYSNPARDPATQLLTAINGMIGNVIRMAEAGILIGIHVLYQRRAVPSTHQ